MLAANVLIVSRFETLDISSIRDSIQIMDGEKEAKRANYREAQIDALKDPEGLQITLKQIMEVVAGGKMNSRDAAVLLRTTQVGVNAEEKWG